MNALSFLPLFALLLVAGICEWIAEVVIPETWAVGERFGSHPTRFEHGYRVFVKILGKGVAVVWWLYVVALVTGAILG